MATLADKIINAHHAGWRRSIAAPLPAGTSQFAYLLPQGRWAALPPAVRRRFERKALAAAAITYAGEVVECFFRDADDMLFYKDGSFLGAILRVFEGAFPFQYGPSFKVIGGELAEDAFEIDLSVAQ